MSRVPNKREAYFTVFVKREGKKSGVRKEHFEDAKEAIKKAMQYLDRTNTVSVKQYWWNPKSKYTGDDKVFEVHAGEVWVEEKFAEELREGKWSK